MDTIPTGNPEPIVRGKKWTHLIMLLLIDFSLFESKVGMGCAVNIKQNKKT